MSGDPSAYAALGLRPGASRAQVDEAYRRLIKLHHPDRAGGDGGRAAEINRAYTLIRRAPPKGAQRPRRAVVVTPPPRARRQKRAPAVLLLALAGAALAGLIASDSHDRRSVRVVRAATSALAAMPESTIALPSAPSQFDEPLRPAIIANAIAAAVEFHASGDIAGATGFSRDCAVRLQATRDLGWFDACAAFDEAALAVESEPGAPTAKQFDTIAVISREMAAARALSGDTPAAESRLRRIRLEVEMALATRTGAEPEPEPEP